MKKKSKIILAIILAAILVPCILMYLRYRSNVALGEELRKEADAWLASLPKIPESQNGAPIINKAIEQFEDFYDVFQDWAPHIDSEVVATTLRRYLADKKEALELIEEGLAYKKWAFTTDYEKGYGASIPNLLWFKNAAKVYSLKGDLAGLEGRNSDALREYLNMLRLASTLSDERALISQMIHVAVCFLGLQRTSEFVLTVDLPETDLFYALDRLLKLQGKQVNISLAFESEYFGFIMIVSDLIEGKTVMAALFGGEQEGSDFGLTVSKFIYDYRQDVEIFRKCREVCQKADPANYYAAPEELKDSNALFEKIGFQPGSWRAFLAQIALPSLIESVKPVVETETMFRGTILLTAIRLYEAKNGSLPGSLNELGELVPKEILIDPFSGKELIYRREGDDFYLYSAGYNGIDDKCKDSKPIFEDGIDRESVPDIVFHAPDAPGK